MKTQDRDPWLLTPGPLTTSARVKEAMLHDWGSRDTEFIAMNKSVRERLVALAGGEGDFVCVPLQGSGSFVVEAAIGTIVPPAGKLLVLVNGAYGKRMVRICRYYGRAHGVIECAEDVPCDAGALDAALARDDAITHVAVVHCETTSGILNPVAEIAAVAAGRGKGLIIDAMSAFGAIGLDARETRFDAVVASSNKCLEGVPGFGYAIVRTRVLADCAGNSPSLVLDLHDQWRAMEANAQWRFTPPTHVLAAFHQALLEHDAEGGVAGRGARYQRNCEVLVGGMRAMGFHTLLPDELQAPIIVTFHVPDDPMWDFQTFYDALNRRGFVIYPGKLTVAESFRIGCIGRLGEQQISAALDAVRVTLAEMGITRCAPAFAVLGE